MTDVFNEALHSWQNFYFMIGGVAATLIGLMFVTLSLGMHLISKDTKAEMQVFVTPSIVYFVSALLIASVILVPILTPPMLALTLFVGGVVGLGRTAQYARKLTQIAKRHQDFETGDWLGQVILPIINYGLLVLTALLFAVDQWSMALTGLWLTSILLLVCAISNTWSLVIWIIDQREP